MARKTEMERHFALALSSCEEPQFLRYQAGDSSSRTRTAIRRWSTTIRAFAKSRRSLR
jgi:predicted 2-oxoglutarate/Fe(II)-dependent dioxygenase YbiX